MKLIIVFCVILLSFVSVWASPFLVCDPSPEAIGLQYEVISNGAVVFSGDNEPDGSIRVDLQSIPAGDYSYTARYVKHDELWGTTYSAPSNPCVFTRPPVTFPINPASPRLLK